MEIKKNTLFIVDDHKMLQNGIKGWLEANSEFVGTGLFTCSADCLSALENCDALPEIIIIDVQLVGETGFVLLQKLSEQYPQIKCIMYSMYDTAGYVLQAQNMGAKGYISKIASEEELLECIRTVQKGKTYLEPRLEFEKIQKKLESITDVLTKQELIVFEKMLQGKTNDEITEELFVSLHTVRNYVTYIYNLAEVHNRKEFLEKFQQKQ
ncbi:MAG: response regulator transcription factor [Treponemataceae bacterium]|nr:response regulator transcription factor [Treponemataceae bacterium]